jgi:hypothetical protein
MRHSLAGLFWVLSDRLHKTIANRLKASLKRRIQDENLPLHELVGNIS